MQIGSGVLNMQALSQMYDSSYLQNTQQNKR